MAIRVMHVDDSVVVRGLVQRELAKDPNISMIASAMNGALAIPLAAQHQPDIIILDIEMPVMDGITALPELLKAAPKARVIMASTLTVRNADITLRAFNLGASECIAKPTARTPDELTDFYRELRQKIYALAGWDLPLEVPPDIVEKPIQQARAPITSIPGVTFSQSNMASAVHAVAIASSTGGPPALQKLFEGIKGRLMGVPIFITQHMPPTFTTILAESLNKIGGRPCAEGRDGEEVLPGHAYMAPGDYHMLAVRNGGKVVLQLNQSPPVNFCRPAADPMLESLSAVYKENLLIAVLTGMGQDGLAGARIAVSAGASVIAQDEATSVVWGMPRAVANANLCQAVLPLQKIPDYLIQRVGC